MRLQKKEPQRHRVEFLKQITKIARVTHLLSVNGHHIMMKPITDKRLTRCRFGLSDLALMMRKLILQTSAMNIDRFAEVLHTHRRALDMPARKSHSPRRLPLHNMFGFSFLPKCKVLRITFIATAFYPARFFLIFDLPARKFTIVRVFRNIEIDIAACFVCKTFINERFDDLDLFYDMP